MPVILHREGVRLVLKVIKGNRRVIFSTQHHLFDVQLCLSLPGRMISALIPNTGVYKVRL